MAPAVCEGSTCHKKDKPDGGGRHQYRGYTQECRQDEAQRGQDFEDAERRV